MCQTGKCPYECRKGFCTVHSLHHYPEDALCMIEDIEEEAQETEQYEDHSN
jgi:hypothetical protein